MNVMEDLKAYVDGELSPEARAKVDAAMEQDERLRQEMEEIRVLSRLLGDCLVEIEPVGLEQTLTALQAHRPKPLFLRLFTEPRRFGWAMALVLFIALAAYLPTLQSAKFAAKSEDSMESVLKDSHTAPTAGPAMKESGRIGFGSGPVGSAQSDETESSKGAGSGYGATADELPAEKQRNGTPSVSDYNGIDGAAPATPAPKPQKNERVFGEVGGWSQTLDAPHIEKSVQGKRLGVTAGVQVPRSDVAKKSSTQSQWAQPLLLRTADITIRVDNAQKAQADATNRAKAMGGWVEQSAGASYEGTDPEATLTVRVPEDKFEYAVGQFRMLGKVIAESTSGQDVTAQVADDEARIRVLRASETSYLAMLEKARKVDDALEIRDRLDNVRQEIESLDSTRKTLRNQATYSTISLTLTQQAPKKVAVAPKQPSWFDTAWAGAANRATGAGKWLAEAGMNLVVLAPLWIPIVIGLWWLGRRR